MSGISHVVTEIYDHLGFYTAWIDSLLLTFRDHLSIPSSKVKQSKKNAISEEGSSRCV